MALTDKLTSIANAIRAKTGDPNPLTLDQMPHAIASIQTGGGTGGNTGGDTGVSYWTEDEVRTILNKNSTLTTISIPNGTNVIPDNFFSSLGLTEITLPETLLSIGAYAFAYNNFTEIKIPDTVSYASDGCFQNCSNLSKVTLPNHSDYTYLSGSLFANCTSLQNITIPNTITNICYNCFAYCTSLKSVTIPENVTSVDTCAFDGSGLESVTFECSGTGLTIAPDAFCNCNNLKHIYVPWASGAVADAPWGATNATIHYNS